jgi:hypothetical protein
VVDAVTAYTLHPKSGIRDGALQPRPERARRTRGPETQIPKPCSVNCDHGRASDGGQEGVVHAMGAAVVIDAVITYTLNPRSGTRNRALSNLARDEPAAHEVLALC